MLLVLAEKKQSDFDFYTIEEVGPKTTRTYSGSLGKTIEAISAVEIKSKASGEFFISWSRSRRLYSKRRCFSKN
ncbi:MAG: hypothetical protein CM1200mP12_21920 [Gammaproteobacteria bacterium]|nr:MAG: hypothetical protein CM1200mP12_21920 [Gammaproteobacteria bacterium]